MIYTVTLNPSLDYILSVPGFELGKTNRASEERLVPGGKGINVSTVLMNLGFQSTALGFTAGFTGKEIQKEIHKLGFLSDFIHIPGGFSRINVKFKNYEGTEINGNGPSISLKSLELFYEKLNQLTEGDILVLAGSIPASIPATIYQSVLDTLQSRGILFVVDAAGDLLLNTLSYRPFLIKPNQYELAALFPPNEAPVIRTRKDAFPYAQRLQELGARNVLVSLGGKGAALLSETGKKYELPAPKGTLVNAVGAGDSMVAGFLAGWLDGEDAAHAFRMAVAAGSATAFSEGLAGKEEIERLYQELAV